MSDQRTKLFDRAHALRNEIAQIFLDAHHWNGLHPEESPINPDPDGTLARLAKGLDGMLASENGGRRLILPVIEVAHV